MHFGTTGKDSLSISYLEGTGAKSPDQPAEAQEVVKQRPRFFRKDRTSS